MSNAKEDMFYASVEDLYPNSWNPNVLSPDMEDRLENSIKRNTVFKPLVVREVKEKKGYEILGGEHRWTIAKRLKHTTIPVFNLGPIDDEKAKEIVLADNARYGMDDTAALQAMMNDMDVDSLQEILPISASEISNLFSSSDIDLDELEIEETEEKPEKPEEKAPKPVKTHQIMRFKIAIGDAERLSDLIERTKIEQGFTAEDDTTNAGDALLHLLFAKDADEE